MILVSLRLQEDGRLCAFEVSGHAGLGAKGQDVLCAGVSAIAETLAGAITDLLESGTAERKEGWMRIVIDSPGPDSELLAGAALLAIRRLMTEHPERIRIEILPDRGPGATEHRRQGNGT